MTTVVQALDLVSSMDLRESEAIVDWQPRTVLVPSRPLLSDSLVDRLVQGLSRDLANEPQGCTTWTRAVTKDGYGAISNGHTEYVHRLVWELEYGPVPTYVRTEEGWKRVVLDHWCHTRDQDCPGGRQCQHRRCGRIDHLRLATHRTNTGLGRRWALTA